MDRNPDGTFADNNKVSPGRQLGSRNRETHWARQLHSEHGAEANRKIVENMRGGEERVSQRASEFIVRNGPRHDEERIVIELPGIKTVADCDAAMDKVLQEASRGEITLRQARELMVMLKQRQDSLVATDLQREVEELRVVADEYLALKKAFEDLSSK